MLSNFLEKLFLIITCRFGMQPTKRRESMLLIGVWANRNWILGNWLKEILIRNPRQSKIWWVVSVFASKHFWEKLLHFPLPKYGSYFFSYPSIFESYLKSNPGKFKSKSIVNYTHNESELGTIAHQASILNQAFSVHFNCSRDAENLVDQGLDPKKVRLVYGAIDEDCSPIGPIEKEPKTVLLASRYGARKGLDILPSLVQALPDWHFFILGRGWESFLTSSGLIRQENVEYTHFNKSTRNMFMKRAKIFLSLSSLEGGPLPLIESMSWNCIPIATDTGFARDFIVDSRNGFILPVNPTTNETVTAIEKSELISVESRISVAHLTWERISGIVWDDHRNIILN